MVNVNIKFRVMPFWFVRQYGVSIENSIRNIPFEISHRFRIIKMGASGKINVMRTVGWDPK